MAGRDARGVWILMMTERKLYDIWYVPEYPLFGSWAVQLTNYVAYFGCENAAKIYVEAVKRRRESEKKK